MNRERNMLYQRRYYEKNRYRLCRHKLDEYFPRVIREANGKAGQVLSGYYLMYPFDKFAEPLIRKKMRGFGIRQHQAVYQECFDAAMMSYMYSLSRCAICSYEHVEAYLRKMISIGIIIGLGCSDETREICRTNDFTHISIDMDRRKY